MAEQSDQLLTSVYRKIKTFELIFWHLRQVLKKDTIIYLYNLKENTLFRHINQIILKSTTIYVEQFRTDQNISVD